MSRNAREASFRAAVALAVLLQTGCVPDKVTQELKATREAALKAAQIAHDGLNKVAEAVPGERMDRLVFAMNGPDGPEKDAARKVIESLFHVKPEMLNVEAEVTFAGASNAPIKAAVFVAKSNTRHEVEGFVASSQWRPDSGVSIPAVPARETVAEARERVSAAVAVGLDTFAGHLQDIPPASSGCEIPGFRTQPSPSPGRGVPDSGVLFGNHVVCGPLGNRKELNLDALASASRQAQAVAAQQLADAILHAYDGGERPTAPTVLSRQWTYIVDQTPILFVLIANEDLERQDSEFRVHINVHQVADHTQGVPNVKPIALTKASFLNNPVVPGQLPGEQIRWATANVEGRNIGLVNLRQSLVELDQVIATLKSAAGKDAPASPPR